jgi:N utilization substance protein B
MFSRRLLRVKILQLVYAHQKSGDANLNSSEKELFFSIDKAYDLYHYLLLLLLEIADYAQSRIDLARNKRIPSEADLNPNTRFVNNTIISQLRNNDVFLRTVQNQKLSWADSPEIIREIYNKLIESGFYKKFMEAEHCTLEDEKKVISRLYSDIISETDLVYQLLEEQSIYWNDDVEFIISMIIKTVKHTKQNTAPEKMLLRKFKNDDDLEFTKKLFRKSILKRDETREIIEKFTLNWDFDRIAYMDVLIMQMALTEVQEFSSIPVKVTLNEYLELAKFFSTKNSSNFINGVLDKAIAHLKSENKIKKQGRGLVGEA